MIEHLKVENVALIETAEIEFERGLNILSGETGAGKSMLIDSIIFLLGERANKDFVRHGADTAYVEGHFLLPDASDAAFTAISEQGIIIDSDNRLIISRSLSVNGKGNCRINGKAVTTGQLKAISAYLVDLHGQHEHQSLLNPGRHIDLLDKFCGEKLDFYKAQLTEILKVYRDVLKQTKDLVGADNNLDIKKEILEMQKNEIESVKLQNDEEDRLLERRNALLHNEKLTNNAGKALQLLHDGDEGLGSAADRISRAAVYLNEIAVLDPRMDQPAEVLESLSVQLEDVVMEVRHYFGQLEANPDELNAIEERLNEIYKLKRKYGGSIGEVVNFYKKICEELEELEGSGKRLEELTALKKKYTEGMMQIAKKMSDLRKNSALRIKKQIMLELEELGMKNARFDILIERKKEFGGSGYDKVEFLISTNTGEALKPLAKIASGGEISRIMLALKTVLADADNIESFIFDEIDTGVSGRTAQKVAEKLVHISSKHQILCITHLPQIAAMSDCHLLIEKKSNETATWTEVNKLNFEKSVSELARLIGGAQITGATLAAADEMKRQALEIKKG